MDINLSGHHVEITPALRDYVIGKFDRIKRHFDNVVNANVVLGVERMAQKAEATIHVRGSDLFANAEAENMYAAIDALIDKLDRQIKKYKEKHTDYHRMNNSDNL